MKSASLEPIHKKPVELAEKDAEVELAPTEIGDVEANSKDEAVQTWACGKAVATRLTKSVEGGKKVPPPSVGI